MRTMTLTNNNDQQHENESSENRRYLRYTQWLNGLGALFSTLLAVWILVSPERRTDPAWVYWLVLTFATLHTQEEYLFPGGFVAWFNTVAFGSPDPNFPLSAKRAFQTDGLAAIFVLLILLVAGNRWLPVVFVFAMLHLVNAFFHIMETIKHGKYSPGVITGLFLSVPGVAYLTYFYVVRGLLSPLELAIVFAIAVFLHAAFFMQTRGWLQERSA